MNEIITYFEGITNSFKKETSTISIKTRINELYNY